MKKRQEWVSSDNTLSISKQCKLLCVTRSVIYARLKAVKKPVNALELNLLRLIDEEYNRHPFLGSRKIMKYLHSLNYKISRKYVQKLMCRMGLAAIAPGPNTSKAHPMNLVYPYLLRGLDVVRPNQVWSTDISYIKLPQGFVYVVAIIDWYSRKTLSWRISNTMDTSFCVDCLEDAIDKYGKPEIFNSDQGSQFTSEIFTNILIKNNITISMDGRGRAFDNIYVERLWRTVKYENIYLYKYETMKELTDGLKIYFNYYNDERHHQSLKYRTPASVYESASGGGAKIVDKYLKDNYSEKQVGQHHLAGVLNEAAGLS